MQGQSMRFVGLVGILFAVMAGTAQAHPRHHSRARRAGGFTVVDADRAAVQAVTRKRPRQPDAPVSPLAPRACPAGIPTQTVTLIDQTGQSLDFAGLERALTDQSLQLRAAWGTPCVVFGPGGWPVYVQTGEQQLPDGETTYQVGGYHYPGPYATVQTGDLPLDAGGARPISHELVEMLVNPTDAATWQANGIGGRLEVCDPVEELIYQLDGFELSDFVTPAYFAGATLGPWDEMRALSAPHS